MKHNQSQLVEDYYVVMAKLQKEFGTDFMFTRQNFTLELQRSPVYQKLLKEQLRKSATPIH